DHVRNGIELLQQVEAAAAGHLDVEKEQVRFDAINLLERLFGIGRFAGDLHLGVSGEQSPQLDAGQALIVHDESLDGTRLHCEASLRGSSAVACTQPSASRTSSVPAGPKSRLRRRAALSSPIRVEPELLVRAP